MSNISSSGSAGLERDWIVCGWAANTLRKPTALLRAMIENAKQSREAGAAVDSLRNIVVAQNNAVLAGSVPARAMLPDGSQAKFIGKTQ